MTNKEALYGIAKMFDGGYTEYFTYSERRIADILIDKGYLYINEEQVFLYPDWMDRCEE